MTSNECTHDPHFGLTGATNGCCACELEKTAEQLDAALKALDFAIFQLENHVGCGYALSKVETRRLLQTLKAHRELIRSEIDK